jgi:hypothetical protein
MRRARTHVRGNAIAYLALFVALGGTGAWAADKITSKDIAKNAVRGKHIKDGQVKVKDADLTKSRFASDSRSVDNSALLPELNLTVGVKRGDVVSIQGFALARDPEGPGNDACSLALFAEGPGLDDQATVLIFDTALFQRRYINGTATGSTSFRESNGIDYLVPANGQFRLRPALLATPLSDCEIQDRGLALTVQR